MKKKSINDLVFSKNVITKFAKGKIQGGRVISPTFTCAASPMTSCNGKCLEPVTCDTSAATGCVESVDIC